MYMKRFAILLLILPLVSFANEECIFDEKSQNDFIEKYISTHTNTEKLKNNKGVRIIRNDESIEFSRGGCVHFGISIKSKSTHKYTESEFFNKVIALVNEFGTELININELKNALQYNKWKKYEGIYFVQIKNVASFEMEYDGNSEIYVGFYIN